VPFEDLPRDAALVLEAMKRHFDHRRLRSNFQFQVLSGLFFRNKGAYVIGRILNGAQDVPFALAILHNDRGRLYVDAALFGEDDISMLFSFARAYFMVDMEVPSAYVQFLRYLMPRKPRAELYNALGLVKQGKTLFYRDLLFHMRHSTDRFRIAPGIKGLVMLVFDLPSFPFVFKIVKDVIPPPKETTREQVRAKYQLVKRHDRVGRMADTLEFSLVAFPRERFCDELIKEIRRYAPSQIEISDRDGDGRAEVILKHVYIERRMVPLNIHLQELIDVIQGGGRDGMSEQQARAQLAQVVIDYGNAIKEMVAANIFPGDMLWKNFGLTRQGRVVFYDYDEIEYVTDCHFRAVPPPRCEEDELSGEVWYPVGPRDVFPETFAPFLLGHPLVRDVFMAHHADLFDPAFWQSYQQRIAQGYLPDVFPYDQSRRFRVEPCTRGGA
jgi:isocitrate dehydrogenase kinase/phosphatase